MKKKGIAKLGDVVSNIVSGNFKSYEYTRQPIPDWNIKHDEYMIIKNVNIVDVNLGKICQEQGILIQNKRIVDRILPGDLEHIKGTYPIKREIDGQHAYIIPGLSDLHGHTTLISEFDLTLKGLRSFDAQRQKNCEEALKAGCTFVRDSGGAFVPVSYLQQEINADRLLGPKIMACYEVLSPKGGMWDINVVMNYLAQMIFGGKVLNFPTSDQEIVQIMDRLHEMGCEGFKTYFEEKPLYGGTEHTIFTMFTREQTQLIRKIADEYGKILEAHSMFLKGSRRVIDAHYDTIAHMTVDEPYSIEDANQMVKNHVAIIPTLSLGCYLAMNCGKNGYPHHPELKFFQDMLHRYVPDQIERSTIPELRKNYMAFYTWINKEMDNRKMPAVGSVYPKRIHGFAVNAPESFTHFQDAGTCVGVGTDGGTGITFVGQLAIEFEAYHRYGYSPSQILRMATLGNMEILHKDDEFGSIEQGKYADLVVLEKNPINDIHAIQDVFMVFKHGRLYYQKG